MVGDRLPPAKLTRNIRHAFALAVLAATIGWPVPALAGLSSEDARIVARVERYLNSIRTLTARFIQVESNGWIAEGMLHLQRPGKLRIEYAPPHRFLILSTGRMLIVYSGKTDQVTHLPMSVSPAAFLLGKRVDLRRKVSVTKVARKTNTYVLTVVPRGGGGAGTLKLTFSRRPLMIKEWTVLDAKRKTTRIVLLDPRIDAPIDPVKFLFQKPPVRRAGGGSPKRGKIERMDLPN